MTSPHKGDRAPGFTIVCDTGPVSLGDFIGKKLVLYFYPKDDTPGCTTEGRDFSVLLGDFANADTHVIGISRDTIAAHAKFRKKHGLNIDLGADIDGPSPTPMACGWRKTCMVATTWGSSALLS